ncbi:tRNA pseudouridine(38/39) synthase [Engraulis encrasicolus]|uniref:tRNA pseudouridine(38/39) synthase n=1 Tax=Engraulis encrasicolus TaxID=184585 RepID=UPI002FCF1886
MSLQLRTFLQGINTRTKTFSTFVACRASIMSQDLEVRVKELESEVERLKSELMKRDATDAAVRVELNGGELNATADRGANGGNGTKKGKKRGQDRPLDFSAYPRRHVALKLAYLGWDYQGYAVQDNTDNTVEARLFEAFLKTKLIQDRQSSNYHRCGRTDKGVSAFSQVVSIDLRSNQFGGGLGVIAPSTDSVGCEEEKKKRKEEMPYTKMLNRVLPQDIRVLDWAPVETGFSARFDCRSRTYRYYFPRGSLDVALMAEAAKRYEGTYDFRNLCKMDVGNGVLQFNRTILSASVSLLQPHPADPVDPYDLCVFEVKGLAFLYHQVRCMMAVLLLIGQKLESPVIINQLLDVEKNPRKPQYSMALDYPLVLHDCHFEGLSWQREPEEVRFTLNTMHQQWTNNVIKTQVLRGMIQGLELSGETEAPIPLQCWLLEGTRQRNYRPLLERPRCESLESRIDHFVKRGRLEREEGENGEEALRRGKRPKHADPQ